MNRPQRRHRHGLLKVTILTVMATLWYIGWYDSSVEVKSNFDLKVWRMYYGYHPARHLYAVDASLAGSGNLSYGSHYAWHCYFQRRELLHMRNDFRTHYTNLCNTESQSNLTTNNRRIINGSISLGVRSSTPQLICPTKMWVQEELDVGRVLAV